MHACRASPARSSVACRAVPPQGELYIVKYQNLSLGHRGCVANSRPTTDNHNGTTDTTDKTNNIRKNNIVPLNPSSSQSCGAVYPYLQKPVRRAPRTEDGCPDMHAFERRSCVFAFGNAAMANAVCAWVALHATEHDVCFRPPNMYQLFSVSPSSRRAPAEDLTIEAVSSAELQRVAALNNTSACVIDAARKIWRGGQEGLLFRGSILGFGASNRNRRVSTAADLRAHLDAIYHSISSAPHFDYMRDSPAADSHGFLQ